jgi:hypothetical protein
MKQKFYYQKGQTLVLLLLFMVVAIMITTASVAMIVTNIKATDKISQGTTTVDLAESGAENAIIKLLRDPKYSGETRSFGGGQVVITITGTNPKTVISKATINNFTRTIQVTVDMTNNILTMTSWKEIF